MKTIRIKLIAMIFFVGSLLNGAYAQCVGCASSPELITNGDFETTTGYCTSGPTNELNTDVTPVQGWFGTYTAATDNASPDYYNSTCGNTTIFGAPFSTPIDPCATSSFVGIFVKASFANGREYFQGQLGSALVAGHTYCFSMTVRAKTNASGTTVYGCDGIGAWFNSVGMIDVPSMNGGNQNIGPGSIINGNPQVQNPQGNIIGTTCVTVSGTFCATGGETWVAIGNFRNDASTTISGGATLGYLDFDNLTLKEVCNTPLNVTLAAVPTTVCPGACTTITATATGGSGAYTYSWAPGGVTTNTLSACPAVTTTYTLTTNSASACIAPLTNTTTITINVGGPTVTVNSPTICNGQNTTLTATPSTGGGTYSWSPGGATTASITVNPASTMNYTCTYTLGSCSSTATSTVTVNPLPTINVNSPTICNGASATLTATGGTTYLWNTGSTVNPLTVSPTTTTSYTVTGTTSGCSNTAVATVTVNSLPTINVNSPTICNGSSATLTATGGTTYLWNTGSTVNPLTVSPTTTATYTVTGTTSGCSTTATSTVSVLSDIVIANLNAVCNTAMTGYVVSFEISGGDAASYVVTGGAGSVTSSAPYIFTSTLIPSASTNYSFVVNDVNNCSPQTVSGTQNCSCPASAVISGGGTACVGSTVNVNVTLSGTAPWAVVYFDGTTTSTVTGINTSPYVITASASGTYSLASMNDANCVGSVSGSAVVTINPLPIINVNSVTICNGASAILTATGGTTYSWNTGSTANPLTVSPTTTTTYTVTGTTSGCINTAIATVTVNQLPTINVNSPTICNGASATLTATGGTTYLWNTGSTANPLTVSPTTTTTYTVMGTTSGCNDTVVATVTVNSLPTINVNSPTICNGVSATLTATGTTTYSWNTGSTANPLTVSPTITTTYTVTGTTSGCSNTAAATVTVNNCTTSSCGQTCGSSLVLNGGFENSTSFCTVNDIQMYNNQTPVQNWFGTDTYSASSMAGSTPDYFSPCAGISNNANNACYTGTARVGLFTHTSFSNGREYVQSQLATPLVAGKTYCFSMTVKSKVGAAGNLLSSCDGIGAWIHNQGLINIGTMNGGTQFLGAGTTINAVPQIDNTPGNLIGAACATISGSFCAQGGEQWVVLGNFRDDANTQISGPNSLNYMYIDDVSLFEVCKTVNLTAAATNINCGQSTTLTTSVVGFSNAATYTWIAPSGSTLSGAGPHVVSPHDTTTYQVVVAEPGNCGIIISDTASITINVNGTCGPYTSINDTTICSGACYSIAAQASTGGTAPYTYTWSPNLGSGTGPFTVCPVVTTKYKVTVTDAAGLSYTDSATVTVNTMPIVNAGVDVNICNGTNATLYGTASIGIYQWIGGPQFLSFTVSPTTTTSYVFESTNAGCTDKDTVVVHVFNKPQLSMSHTDVTCFGANNGTASAIVQGGTSPISYLWSLTNATTPTITNLSPNTYSVTVTDINGCSSQNNALIAEPGVFNVSIAGAGTLCAGHPENLQAVTTGGSTPITYQWLNMPNTTSFLQVSPITNQSYTVVATDNNGCQSASAFNLAVNPGPDANFVESYTGCAPVYGQFTNNSTGANGYVWNFGDNTSSTTQNGIHTYKNQGCYNVTLIASNQYGCKDTIVKTCAVKVYPAPIAELAAESYSIEESSPDAVFTSTTTGATSCSLDFGDGIFVTNCASMYTHTYSAAGVYTVMQIATNAYGCKDTAITHLEVKPETAIYVPNAFTPNHEGLNETFNAYGINIKEFEMNIFDRWGEKLFTSKDINTGWDGTFKNNEAQPDVYVWTIDYSFVDGVKQKLKGTVTLVK